MSHFDPLRTFVEAAKVAVMFVVALLIFGLLSPPAPASAFGVPIELVKPEVAVARVAACGFKNVQSVADETLQEEVVKVMDASAASPEQLRCVALASLDTHYYVTFPPHLEQTYQTLYWELSEDRGRVNARTWLEARGLLSRLPTYDRRSDETTFVAALEAMCGPKAAGTLEPVGGGATFKKGALPTFERGGYSKGRLDDETLLCLHNAAAASGYSLGFISNAARP